MEKIVQLLTSYVQEDVYIGIKLLSLEKEEDIPKILKLCGEDISLKIKTNKLVIRLDTTRRINWEFVVSNGLKFFVSTDQLQYAPKDYDWSYADNNKTVNLDE